MKFVPDWRLLLYNLAITLYSPVILLRKWRHRQKKLSTWQLDPLRWHCPVYYGKKCETSSSETHVVFVGIGIGEMRAMEQLSHALHAQRSGIRTTWALRCRETMRIIQKEHPEQDVAFMPFDFFIPLWNWTRRLKPDVVVTVEKLFLPNIVWYSKRRGARVMAVNGSGGVGHKRFLESVLQTTIQRWTLSGFDLICLHSEEEREKIAPLLPPGAAVRVTGSMKFENRHVVQNDAQRLAEWLGDASKPLIIAGSTHAGEEELVIEAFKKVRIHIPCRLLIAPRHLHETEQLMAALSKAGIENCARRSAHVASGEYSVAAKTPPDVFALDTLGELPGSYQLAQVAYVGGTLHGPGHNVIEPLEAGIAVAFGPGRGGPEKGKPTKTQAACMDAGIGFRVTNSDELAQFWLNNLQNSKTQSAMQEKISAFLEAQHGAIEKNVAAILEVLDSKPF